MANETQARDEVFARYDRGPDLDALNEPCKYDRYGFKLDPQVPYSTTNDNEMVENELSRAEKWERTLKNWDKVAHTPEIRKMFFDGVPDQERPKAWRKLLHVDDMKQLHVGEFKVMKALARRQSPFIVIHQIDLDVNRTYRNHEMFRERYGIKQQALFHVLAAYSMYNTEVGYCQGMSQVAALLLMYNFREEDAFWGMSALFSDKEYAMHGFFIPGFPKLMRFQSLHEEILKKYLPKVKKHMDEHDVHTNLYLANWFLQCLLDSFPFHLCLRLWDILLYEGERLLIAMAFNVFRMHENRILKLNSLDGIVNLLHKELKLDFGYPNDEVIKRLGRCMEDLRASKLDDLTSANNERPVKPYGRICEKFIEENDGLKHTVEGLEQKLEQKAEKPLHCPNPGCTYKTIDTKNGRDYLKRHLGLIRPYHINCSITKLQCKCDDHPHCIAKRAAAGLL